MDWVEWSKRLDRRRDVLERIVALLLTLATVAERAAGLSASHRESVLRILAYGEAEARTFVIAMARDCGAPVEPADVAMARDQAERLAASFRALALILGAMLSLARRFTRSLADETGLQARLPVRRSAEPKRLRWVAASPALDTS